MMYTLTLSHVAKYAVGPRVQPGNLPNIKTTLSYRMYMYTV